MMYKMNYDCSPKSRGILHTLGLEQNFNQEIKEQQNLV